MDEDGCFNFSASVTYTKALTECAKLLIVETSARLRRSTAARSRCTPARWTS
jgi:acyl-CoA hydrolase